MIIFSLITVGVVAIFAISYISYKLGKSTATSKVDAITMNSIRKANNAKEVHKASINSGSNSIRGRFTRPDA